MDKPKKIVLSAILLLILIGGALAANSKQILSIISGIEASNSPVITNAFLDKTKYVSGDSMLITASAEDSKGIKEVKAEIDNENGIDTVKLNLIGGDDKEGTYQAVWTVHDVTGKKIYKTKVVAINSEERQSEFALYWIDPAPNPGHTAGEIGGTTDGERTFNSAGLYTFQGQIEIEGGTPGAGKVLTSDANGLASWETAGGIPSGAIIMWSGMLATIPSGWQLCDGTNSTPDLRAKFIYGTSASENPGTTGGNTVSNWPQIWQQTSQDVWSNWNVSGSISVNMPKVTFKPSEHTQTAENTSTANNTQRLPNSSYTDYAGGGGGPNTRYIKQWDRLIVDNDFLPPFYKLAFICKL